MADDVNKWLDDHGLAKYGEIFASNEIDLSILSRLTEEDLKELGLPLGARRKLQAAIEKLPEFGPPSTPSSATSCASSSISESTPSTNYPASSEPSLVSWERQPEARKPATVLFADITGSTALTEHLDAEDAHDLLDGARQRMCAAIKSNRGTVCRVMGDGVMAVFGAPVASENHAVEACEAALQMQQAIRDYTHELRGQHGSGLKIRIGLHSGEIVVLVGGEGDQVEYDADGPTVPVAARMEQIAQPGNIYLTAATHSLAENRIEADALEAVSVKGISAPIKVFTLRQVKSPEEAAVDVRNTPFVGRRAEINQFGGMVETCLRGGEGQTVYVRGEPWIGKTRLVEEFSRNAQQRGLSVHRVLVLPFGVGKGQDAIRSIIRSLLAVAPNSGQAERQRAAREALADGRLEPSQVVFINDLLDLDQPIEQRALYDAMDNATRNQGKQATVSTLLTKSCKNQSILLIVEDVHWAGALTLAHLAALTRTVADTSALLVMTSRIEGDQLDQSWRATAEGSPLTTIDLGPLRPQDSIALISEYVDATDALAGVCLERAAGNPLFLEQLLRSAQEGSPAILPESIQSLILARLDRLEPQHKQALQAAAVLGQRFDTATLCHLLGTANYDIDALVEHNLLRPEGSGYLFAHALIQESVYASLVKGRRHTLHLLAAGWFADSDPVLHAEHLDRAADPGAPLAYLKAAQSQSTRYRTEHALRLAERGLEVASTDLDRFELNCLCAELLHDLGRVVESIDTYRHSLGIAVGDRQRCRAHLGLAAGMRIMDELDDALDMLEQAEAAAIQQNLDAERARIHHLRGNLYFPMGKVDQCVQQHTLALDYARKVGSPELEAMALGGIGDGLYAQGRLLSASKFTSECLDVSRQHGLRRIEVANEPMLLAAHYYRNKLQSELNEAQLAVESARKVGHTRAAIQDHIVASSAATDLGDLSTAQEHIQLCLELINRLGARRFVSRCLLSRARVALVEGRSVDAVRLLEEGMLISKETGIGYVGAAILGTLALAHKDANKREQYLQEGEEILCGDCLAHNYFEFYQDAMEACLELGDWERVNHYASALENFTQAEPLPRTEFFIARGRTLALFGLGNRGDLTIQKLQRLYDKANSVGLMCALPAIKSALSTA